jgi:RHS repeat-associated protein
MTASAHRVEMRLRLPLVLALLLAAVITIWSPDSSAEPWTSSGYHCSGEGYGNGFPSATPEQSAQGSYSWFNHCNNPSQNYMYSTGACGDLNVNPWGTAAAVYCPAIQYRYGQLYAFTQGVSKVCGNGKVFDAQSLDCKCPANAPYISDTNQCVQACPANHFVQFGRCVAYHPPKDRGPKLCVGNPCNPANGNKVQRETLYKGTVSIPLDLALTYNSAEVGDSFDDWLGAHGRKWLASYEVRIKRQRNGTISVLRADGTEYEFRLAPGGGYVSDPDVTDTLTQLTDVSGLVTGWSYLTSIDQTLETFNLSGQLLSTTTRTGLVTNFSYSTTSTPRSVAPGPNLLIQIDAPFGRRFRLYYDGEARIQRIEDPASGQVQFEYDGVSAHRWNAADPAPRVLTKISYPDGKSRVLHYNESALINDGAVCSNLSPVGLPSYLTGITDENGDRHASWTYDCMGRVTRSEHAGGVDRYSLAYSLTANGAISSTAVTDPLNTTRDYNFSRVLGVSKSTSISAPCSTCGAASSAYDINGNPSSRTDFNGNVRTFIYDLTRNLETSRTEASGTPHARTITTQWHPTYRLPTQIDEPGRRTTYTHDANGNVLTSTETDLTVTPNTPRTWTYTYNSFGQVLTADGPRTDMSDLTTYTYYNCNTGYQCGQVETITNAVGHVTTYNSYNAHGQPLTITDPNGVVTTLAYDARQRLTSRAVGAELTSFDYWPTGLLKKATMPDGSHLEYVYDAAHRLTDINDAEGNHIHYTLDAMGNRTAEEVLDPSSALSRTRTRVFNSLNQLHQELGAAGTPQVTTTFGYDNNGNQTSIDAPLGRRTSQTHDELDRLSTVTDPENGLTTYGYNGLDQLVSVTDPRNLTTTYTYNGPGDLKQQVSPDTGTTTNTFDSGGNLKTSTNARNAISTYTYDALNRVKTAAFKVGTTTDQTITYNYDAGTNGKGQLTSASDSAHSMSWTYDPLGRVLSKTQTVTSITKTVGYGYTNGLLTSLTTPSGQAVAYGYTNGQVTSITINGTTLLSNALYDPFGPVRQWTWGNGTLSVRTYDEDGKIEQIDSAGLNTYSYDDAFRITGITDTTNSALSWTYGYDELDRLTSATRSTESFGWTYDADGNRLTQTGSNAQTFVYPTTSNRVSSVSGAITQTYTYNSPGDMAGNGTRTFQYNNRSRMKSTTLGSNITSFIYNALGQRIKKGVTRIFVYDEAGHLLGEYNNSGVLVQETIWLGDTPVATIRPKTGGVDIFYVHTDHLNTPRKVTRPSDNKLRWRWDPTPFGTGAPNDNPESLGVFGYNLRFPGQYYDTESGLHYNYFRDYDPSTGRYVESDPIGLGGGLNTYGYVGGNPLSAVDPWGLAPGDIFNTREAAEADRAIFAALLQERKFALDVILQSMMGGDEWDGGLLSGVYQADLTDETSCSNRFTYDWIEFAMGVAPLPGRGLGNPFKGKSALEIDAMFRAKGFQPRGPDPLKGLGGYVNPRSQRSYHIDEANRFREPPHVDVNRPRDYDGLLDKKKYPFGP